MYYKPWEYIWETEKQHLDYEIGKVEGQLKYRYFAAAYLYLKRNGRSEQTVDRESRLV